MSARIDHAAEARKVATPIENDAFTDREAYVAEAQLHATLALVEQQRIANLIALGQFRVGAGDLPHLRHLVVEAKDEYDLQPTAEIREGLGL